MSGPQFAPIAVLDSDKVNSKTHYAEYRKFSQQMGKALGGMGKETDKNSQFRVFLECGGEWAKINAKMSRTAAKSNEGQEIYGYKKYRVMFVDYGGDPNDLDLDVAQWKPRSVKAKTRTDNAVQYCKARGLYVKDAYNPDDEEEWNYWVIRDVKAVKSGRVTDTTELEGTAMISSDDAMSLLDSSILGGGAPSLPGFENNQFWNTIAGGVVETDEQKAARIKEEKKKKKDEADKKKAEDIRVSIGDALVFRYMAIAVNCRRNFYVCR